MTALDTKALLDRFWGKVSLSSEPGACWHWTGARIPKGYGTMRVGGKVKKVTHVAIWLETGQWPTDLGLIVCHHCDNPSCVRYDHLFLGTVADNNRDRHAKGRTVPPTPPRESLRRGEGHPCAKVTENDVRAMRPSPLSNKELASKFGLDVSTVGKIRRGDIWAHVKQPEMSDA